MDLAYILELIRNQGDLAYGFVASYAASNSMLMPLFAGYAAHMEALSFWPTVIAVWIGGIAGDELRFWLGRSYGAKLFETMPKIRKGVETAARLIDRHHWWMMFIYRYPHGIRGFAGFAFGMSNMPRWRFTLLNIPSAAIWALVLVGIGYVFSEISDKALGEVAGQAALVMLLAFLALAWFLSKRLDSALPDKG